MSDAANKESSIPEKTSSPATDALVSSAQSTSSKSPVMSPSMDLNGATATNPTSSASAEAISASSPPTSSAQKSANAPKESNGAKKKAAAKGATGTPSSSTTSSALASSKSAPRPTSTGEEDKGPNGPADAATAAASKRESVKKEKDKDKENGKDAEKGTNKEPEKEMEKEKKKETKKENGKQKEKEKAKKEEKPDAGKEKEGGKTKKKAAKGNDGEGMSEAVKENKSEKSNTDAIKEKESDKDKTKTAAEEKAGEKEAGKDAVKDIDKPSEKAAGENPAEKSTEEKKVKEAPKPPTERTLTDVQETKVEPTKAATTTQSEPPKSPGPKSESELPPKSPTKSAATAAAPAAVPAPKSPKKTVEAPADEVDKGKGVNGHSEKRDSRGPASPGAGNPSNVQQATVSLAVSAAAVAIESPKESENDDSEHVVLRRQRLPVANPSANANGPHELAAVPKASKERNYEAGAAAGAFGHETEAAALSERVLRSASDGIAVLMASLGFNAGLFDVLAKSEVPLSAEMVADRASLVLPYVETWLANQTLAGFVSRIDPDENDPPLYFLSDAQRQVFVELERADCQVAVLHNLTGQAFNIINRMPREFREGAGIPWTQMHPLTQQSPELIKRRGGGEAFLSALVDALPSGLRARLLTGLGPGDVPTPSNRPLIVLELVCGYGFTMREFARRHPSHLFVGLDSRGSALAMAHRLAVLTARQMGLEKSLGNLVFVEGDPHDIQSPEDMSGVREAWNNMCPTLRMPERFDLVLIIDALTNLADPMAALISSNERTAGAVLVQTALPGVSEMLTSASQCSVTVPCALAGRPDGQPVLVEFSGDILEAAKRAGFASASQRGDSIFVLIP